MADGEKEKEENHRPWGFYEVLSDKPDHKIKRITIYPSSRLSYQRHSHRSEHWHVVRGEALVTLDGREVRLESGQSLDIPKGSKHRVMSHGREDLVFIEVQTGDYFGEDDIERFEDDYGRV